ncbi:efflux RND transporter permease subunit [Candidatus Finniella inopinata]|uniref:Efflux RND transporter permease subunit n=1 Tax=Candidatus Finniella inopinata TaxID=1696036 RepID=A0A4Q7DIT2_9PROT|nr:efflux RND transporter permease subunit [Candidatus Finniella inopinata]RZI46129.1 efflux RND transporter permease subunit [Candidatus Finniella inopinata]
MKLSEICIQRPVFAWVMTSVIIVVGLVGGYRLPLQQYPKIERSFITIETSMPGAGPEIVEAQVTRIIEDAVAGIEGIESITSISSTEDSKVTLEFRAERLIEDATNDIRDKLSKSRDKLQDESITEPILTKSRAEEKAIMTLALTSNTVPASDMYDYAEREIRKDLEALPGVARVDVLGAGQYEMNIFLNPVRLAAYGITVNEVLTALKRQSIEKPAGKIVSRDREYLVTTVAKLEKPEEYENMVIVNRKDYLVRLRDIGRAEVTSKDRKTRTRYNGKPGISIGIIKQSASNPIDVARNVKKELDNVSKHLPDGMSIHTGNDRTIFIEKSIKEVYKTIFEATALVILVVFLFLRSVRASVIPLITIPVSLVGALFIMYLLNFSINMFTLMAMVLAIGLVVDDAIVVLENIYRYLEMGYKPFEASVRGIREISFSVIAMTLTLAAVYAPISLAQGLTGKLLTEFSITLAGAVILSGFAALTLSPMMCARMLKAHVKEKEEGPQQLELLPSFNPFTRFMTKFKSDAWLIQIENTYGRYLRLALFYRHYVLLAALAFAIVGYIVHHNLPSELTPREDQGWINLEGQSPQTATLEYTERYVKKIDDILEKVPEIERRVTQIVNPTFDGSIQLKPDRKRTTDEITLDLRKQFEDITGIEIKINSGSSGISGDDNRAVQFVLRGNKSYRELKDIAHNMTASLYASQKVMGVTSEIRGDTEDFTVSIIRDKVSALAIEPATIADTIDALIRGRKANTFKRDNKIYDVKIEVENSSRASPHDITNLFVKSGDKDGTLVPLSELVKVHSRAGPIEIHHHNRTRAITMNAFLKPGTSMGDGVEMVTEVATDVMPSDARMDFIGDTKRFLTESKTMQFIFALALCFIYLVMAAQFESWRDPFIIILSVPMSLAGAVITLAFIDGGTLNLYSNIGLVTLIGLITKHGILMVDFANGLRDDRKFSALEAIIEACRLRLRPILMTTFAMILGALPLALSGGAGSESQRQLGWVIVGGMTIGTMFTLFVVPAFYTYLSAKKRKALVDLHFPGDVAVQA